MCWLGLLHYPGPLALPFLLLLSLVLYSILGLGLGLGSELGLGLVLGVLSFFPPVPPASILAVLVYLVIKIKIKKKKRTYFLKRIFLKTSGSSTEVVWGRGG